MESEINLKDFFKVLFFRKWWLIGTFLVVLIVGLLFNIFQSPVYNSRSMIGIVDADIYYNDLLYKYFPEEATDLWFSPTYKYSTFIERKALNVYNEISSQKILEMTFEKINLQIRKSDFKNSIKLAENSGGVDISTFYNDPEIAYVINKTLLDVYIAEKNSKFEKTYNDLLSKIDNKTKTLDDELSVLSAKAIESINLINLKYQEEIKKQGLSDFKIDALKIIDPVLSREIDDKYNDIVVLDSIKQNLVENKDYITNKIEIIKEPEKSEESIKSNNISNIIIIIFAALVSGIIVSFIVNYFSSRNRKINVNHIKKNN